MTVLFNAWKILKHRKMAGVRKKKRKRGQRNNEEQMKITKELFNMRTKLCKCFVAIQNFVE